MYSCCVGPVAGMDKKSRLPKDQFRAEKPADYADTAMLELCAGVPGDVLEPVAAQILRSEITSAGCTTEQWELALLALLPIRVRGGWRRIFL